MSAAISDILQRLSNMIRPGIVQSVDGGRVRVSYGDGNVTDLIPWQVGQAGAVKEWNGAPAVGEQVTVFNPGGTGNGGFVARGSIFTATNPANGTNPNSRELDLPADGSWRVTCGNLAVVFQNGSAKITVAGTTFEVIDGKVKITGDVEVTGKITATGDIKAGTISLKTHVHSGVQSGGGNTATPVP
jgi:phage baseplate assembly protein V